MHHITSDVVKQKIVQTNKAKAKFSKPRYRKFELYGTEILRKVLAGERVSRNYILPKGMKRTLLEGDVFQTPELGNVHYEGVTSEHKAPTANKKVLELGHPYSLTCTWNELDEKEFTKKHRNVKVPVGVGKKNRTRLANSKWLVVKTEMTGGGTGHGPNDVYPDGHKVTAIRLNDDDSYSENNQTVQFWQTGSFNSMIEIDQIRLLGTMKQTWAA